MITNWDARALCAATGVIILATMRTADTTTDVQQMDAPTIRPTQKEIVLQSGKNFTLYCSGTSQIQFKQQDVPEEITSDFYTEPRIVNENESLYEVALDLFNVDKFTVGYYACFDDSVDASGVLANIVEEPHDTPHISYIYIYVNGTDSMLAAMRSVVIPKANSKFLIECRPTAPDIKVSLKVDIADVKYDYYSSKVGFIVGSDVPADDLTSIFICVFERQGVIFNKDVFVLKNTMAPLPKPEVFGGPQYFLEGEKFSINCTMKRPVNSGVELVWKIPNPNAMVSYFSNENTTTDLILYNNITIKNATKLDEGFYQCISKNIFGNKTKSFRKKHLDFPKLELNKSNTKSTMDRALDSPALRVFIKVDDYPPADFTFLKDNKTLPMSNNPFTVSSNTQEKKILLTIKNWTINHTGNYTVVAKNGPLTNSSTYDVRVSAAPSVILGKVKKYLLNTTSSLKCEATGYPLPNIEWIFTKKDSEPIILDRRYQQDTIKSLYEIESILEIPVLDSGNITCKASNEKHESSDATDNFIVYEIEYGFGIIKDHTWFPENQDVELTCLASLYDFSKAVWIGPNTREMENVEYTENVFSHVAKLKLNRISMSQADSYTCIGYSLDGTERRNDTITITVAGNRAPVIEDMIDDGKTEEILPFHEVNFTCTADAIPPPFIEWFKDGKPVKNDTNVEVLTRSVDHSTRYSIIKISPNEDAAGKYECTVTSSGHIKSKIYNLLIKEKATHIKMYLSIIGAFILVLILVVVYLAWKIRKEKEFKNELRAAGLLNFKKGAIKSINRDIGIEEQAELLPYDEKFEFPAECLKLGTQLGAGAFGVVYKAEARGIIDAEETTIVAVKMVKKTADNMYIKALATELKIMVHLGKHVNIVNLLGACTKKVGKRELIVIVEYCKFGNIQNYMQKHRDVFIDQFNDNPEKHLGKINRGYSSSSGNSGMSSDYYGSNHTQNTDHTLLNTANTNRSSRKPVPKKVEFNKDSETGYVQPEWRSNYVSDYSSEGLSPRPLYTRDLLAWAFQIARGMEYLANRKILHGDLAARNVLLAEDNIVKICDFGLARSIYKNDEYQKQENSPLPVKWLAIECMTDRIFSTQSDVWSFGIVLWELFSLGKTPYPNVSPPSLLQWLLQGERLGKPAYADDRIYELMKSCWEQKPTQRPTFTDLQTKLGNFLEDNVRNYYVEKDAEYMDMNTKKAGEEDYLAMVTAPDYNNLVTPSPHHYANDAKSFFPPTPNQIPEDERYTQMSPTTRQNICNARPQGTKFDFDARKLAPRESEANGYGSESTPMLTLNNLPRSGSESDQEGQSPPYHSVCPRIEEETDEVFETKLNQKNMQPNSITNPTYITMSADNEKKSQNFINNYINIPNGLVK